jgi:hypothetical protein
VSGIVEIGRKLVEVQDRIPGRYTAFVVDRLGWSMSSAQRFVRVHELFLTRQIDASGLMIDASSLYRIAAPSTPAEVREVVLEKAATFEGVSRITGPENCLTPILPPLEGGLKK